MVFKHGGIGFAHILFIVLKHLNGGVVDASNVASCPIGWILYQKEIPNTCLWRSNDLNPLTSAHSACLQMNSSLVVIQTDEKLEFVNEIVNRIPKNIGILLALQKHSDGVKWWTKDGLIPAKNIPKELMYPAWQQRDSDNYLGGMVLRRNNDLKRYTDLPGQMYYVCEKRADCMKGWFGLACDKECHCHAQECLPTDLEVTCKFSCQLGWMGQDCSKRKEDPAVTYYCANSPTQGKHVQIRIDLKGVMYEKIQAVNADEEWMSWCNTTSIKTDTRLHVVTITIYADESLKPFMAPGSCAGKVSISGVFEWRIKIQEKEKIVSRNDQVFHVECDFKDAITLQLTGEIDIKRERGLRRSDIKRPVFFLEETKDKVELDVVDPFSGKPMAEKRIGSVVALKLTFGGNDNSLVTGVIPYNCFASPPSQRQKIMIFDEDGCPSQGFHISAFHRNGSKSLITDAFPLFGFDGTEDVEFHCSYALCFGNDPCPVGCHRRSDHIIVKPRRRRSTKAKGIKLTMDATGTEHPKILARTPLMRRKEEDGIGDRDK